jgi:hypothetical protein
LATRAANDLNVEVGSVDEIRSSQIIYLADPGVFACPGDHTFSSVHGERFDRLGRYLGGPAAGDLGSYPVFVSGNRVVVDLSSGPQLPSRSPISDDPVGPPCEGAEARPGFYDDGGL